MTTIDDAALAKLLLERGLLAADEYHEAEALRSSTGKPLQEILVEKSMLSPAQLADALAAFQKRIRFCPECKGPVYVPRMMTEGERCPRCLGPIQWQEESVVAQIRDLDSIVQLTRDELPPEVQFARSALARALAACGRCDEAESELLAVQSDNALLRNARWKYAAALADCFEAAGDAVRAKRWRAEAEPTASAPAEP